MEVQSILITLPLLLLAYQDSKSLFISTKIAVLTLLMTLFTSTYFAFFGNLLEKQLGRNHLLAGIIVSAIFIGLSVLTKGKALGEGDIVVIGTIAFTLGLAYTLLTLALATGIGIVVLLLYLILRKKVQEAKLPLVTLLTAGYCITLIFFY